MTANQTESLTTLQTATRRMKEADSADLDTILALASQRAAALDALAASPPAGPAPVLAALERDGVAILARLAEFRSSLRTQLQDLHRESIAVKAYLAPPPY